MADDFTCILRDEFKRFIEELPYEELRQSIFTEELEVADRLLALSERICREFVFFLRILSLGTVICDLETLNRGLPLDLALPSSTGSGWHRKLLSSRSQFTRSLYLSVRPSYNLRSCLIGSVMSSLISQF